MADLFGTFVEAYATGELDWSIGEDIPGRPPVRNLAHPEIFGMPGHMSGYIGSDGGYTPLHYDSAIVNKAMYLAVSGTPPGKTFHGYAVTPIDDDPWAAARLLARCAYNTVQYRLTPASGFTEFAVSMLGAATEIGLASDQAQRLYSSLLEAFLATGILTDGEGTPRIVVSGRVVSSDQGDSAPIPAARVTLEVASDVLETGTDSAGNFLFELDDASATSGMLTASAVGFYDVSVMIPIQAPAEGAAATGSVGIVELELAERPAPVLQWNVSPVPLEISSGDSGTVRIALTNAGPQESQLAYSLRPTVSYTWYEIPFVWDDLELKVLPLHLTGDQAHSSGLLLTKPFPFYLGSFNQLYVSTDGYITLTEDTTEAYRELPIPSSDAPANLIAPFWADLDFGSTDRAYFYYDSSRSVAYVQFQNVPDYAGDFRYTFQIVLFPDGRIRFYYEEIPGAPESWARVGIQDGEGREGLEVAVIRPGEAPTVPRTYSAVELAPSVLPSAGLVSFRDLEGAAEAVIAGGEASTLDLDVSAEGLAAGGYQFQIRAETNDPTQPVVYIPVAVQVE